MPQVYKVPGLTLSGTDAVAGTMLQVSWPLSIVVDDQVLGKYNQILIFLMQVTCSWPALCCLLGFRLAAGTRSVQACITQLCCQACLTAAD